MSEPDREEQRPKRPRPSSVIRWKAFVDEELEKDHQRRAQLVTQTSAKAPSHPRVAVRWVLVAVLALIALVALWFLIH